MAYSINDNIRIDIIGQLTSIKRLILYSIITKINQINILQYRISNQLCFIVYLFRLIQTLIEFRGL